MARGKICTITSRNISSWVCPVDFDGRRVMSSLSLKTVVVHKSVTSLMTEKKSVERKVSSSGSVY